MKRQLFVLMFLFSVILVIVMPACNYTLPTQPVEPAGQVEAALPTATVISATTTASPAAVVTATKVISVAATVEPTATVEVTPTLTATVVMTTPMTPPPTRAVAAVSPGAVPFTATIGLDTFSTYRMDFSSEFDGTRQGQPAVGDLSGFLEVTKNPEAQHLEVQLNGDTFKALAPLGKLEIIDLGSTFYLKSPQDGQWLGVPAFFVKTMLPDGMYAPEDSIDLPVTAVPQPGTEVVNGLVTRRFTFGPADLAGDVSKYDEVAGTTWVAVDGNYVVKYEATFSGQHDNLTAGNITLLDEGTITMRYELSEIDSDLTISPPSEAVSFDLMKLLFLFK